LNPGDGEVGTALRVVVSYRDGDGVAETVASAATQPVANVNDAPNGLPALSPAAPREGSPASALTGAISDADGMVGVTFAHRWEQRQPDATWSAIPGADQSTFTPQAAQVGRALRVVVTYTDNQGTIESLTSAASDPVASPPPATTGSGPGPLAAPLRVAALTVPSVVSAGGAPITVSATVPSGSRVVQIRVFRLTGARSARTAAKARRRLVATVYRSVTHARRYRFRLTEKRLRSLEPGRYVLEVRVGRTRQSLGPATARTITVRKARKARA
jgi:hypothetical protein